MLYILLQSIMSKESLNNTINDLYERYKDDSVILNKLVNHITHDLPSLLINTKKQQKTREDRRILLQEAHDKFVNQFIKKNIYFYCNTSEIFFAYDSSHYSTIKEDTIIHTILSALSLRDNHDQEQILYFEKQLLPWKFKIKTSIIKQVRDSFILSSIPESSTIQNILNIFMNIFETKAESKYFLSIIGDTILKKPTNINIISSSAKTLIRMIENVVGQYFGHAPIQNAFRYKYHEHNYSECRILLVKNKINEGIFEELHKIIIDLVVVACHYSNRYNCADDYLTLCEESDLRQRILFLKNNDQTTIVEKFISSKIQNSTASNISTKNMLYLWKSYLDEIELPNVIFTTTLKSLLKTFLQYDETNDCFIDCTSLSIPFVSNFVKFWDENIKEDITEYYLEVDEICILFKQFLGKNQDVNETTIKHLIRHFYPDISIDGKYIYAISCDSWKKQEDIINYLKIKITEQTVNTPEISRYELYTDYSTKYCKKVKNNIVISKSYFDLFVSNIADKSHDNNTELIDLTQLQFP
jgi:hypothetical protein